MSTPARLYKKQPEPKVLLWVNSHGYIIVPACVLIGFILLIILTYSIGCCVESGIMRNFLAGGV